MFDFEKSRTDAGGSEDPGSEAQRSEKVSQSLGLH